MTDTRKAMQQALELLDRQWQCSEPWSLEEAQDVAEALREALAQQGEQQPVAWIHAGQMPPEQSEMKAAAYALSPWLSAALDDPKVCEEYKSAINAWCDAAMPAAPAAQPSGKYVVTGPMHVECKCDKCASANAAPAAQQGEQPLPHCEAGPEGCPVCRAETYGEKEVRVLRETIASMAKIIEGYESAPAAQPNHTGCACRWDENDNRVATCARHQGWLDVVREWSDRAKDAESQLTSQKEIDIRMRELRQQRDKAIDALDKLKAAHGIGADK